MRQKARATQSPGDATKKGRKQLLLALWDRQTDRQPELCWLVRSRNASLEFRTTRATYMWRIVNRHYKKTTFSLLPFQKVFLPP